MNTLMYGYSRGMKIYCGDIFCGLLLYGLSFSFLVLIWPFPSSVMKNGHQTTYTQVGSSFEACILFGSLLLHSFLRSLKFHLVILSWISAYFFYNIMQMLKKLSKQLSGEDWTWNNLNTLCWAIGSISGSMMEEQVCFNFQIAHV